PNSVFLLPNVSLQPRITWISTLQFISRHEMPPGRGGVEQHVLGPPFNAAFEHRLQRFVGGVPPLEGQVVAEQDEALALGVAEMRKEGGRRANILAMDLDELEGASLRLRLAADCRMHSLDEGALAGAAGAT